MKISKQMLTWIIENRLGRSNVRPIYNGWLIRRDGKWSFCDQSELDGKHLGTTELPA